jgi:hypothetical protein
LKHHFATGPALPLQAFLQGSCLFEWPGFGGLGKLCEITHDLCLLQAVQLALANHAALVKKTRSCFAGLVAGTAKC